MIIYLDESGDLGFDFQLKKPSGYFVITLLVCKNYAAAKAIHKSIERTLKNKINNKINKRQVKQELKGTQTTINTKQYFYRHIKHSLDWSIYTVVLNKRGLSGKLGAVPIHKDLYNNLARHILEKVDFSETRVLLRLIVDRSKNSKEILEFNQHLAEYLKELMPLMIEHQASSDNLGLQAVDLFSWGIFKKYENNDESWYGIFKDRITIEEII